MTSVEVVETSDTLTNRLFQDFIHPDDDSQTAYDLTLLLRSNYFSTTIIPDHGSFYYWELKVK